MTRTACAAVLFACARLASAQCSCASTNFSCSISGGDTVCITPTLNGGTGKWDITISATGDGGNNLIEVSILATVDETAVGAVSISNTAGAAVDLEITLAGTGATTNLESVDSIVGSGTGITTIFLLDTENSCGSISVNRVLNARVRGNLTGNVSATTGRVGTLRVDGSIAGGVAISAATRIDFINVPTAGADIGASGNPASILCADEFRNLFVGGVALTRATELARLGAYSVRSQKDVQRSPLPAL